LPDQLPERFGEMLSVVQQEDPTRSPLHEESDQRGVSLGRVTDSASQNQVVRTVVSRLTPAGPHVVEGNDLIARLGAAIRAYGTVLGEEPISVRLH
jgi:hypothetical protein